MRTLHTITLTLLFLNLSGQVIDFYDYFDANLKGSPSIVKEFITFSIGGYDNPDIQRYKPRELISKFEYHFDSTGKLIKEYSAYSIDTVGFWVDYAEIQEENYGDSSIRISYFPNGTESWREKRYYDKHGFMTNKIVDFPVADTNIYTRDSDHRVIQLYNHMIGVDSEVFTNLTNSYNLNGDLASQLVNKVLDGALWDRPEKKQYLLEFSYIYDDFDNWIFRLTSQNDSIKTITQREIIYW